MVTSHVHSYMHICGDGGDILHGNKLSHTSKDNFKESTDFGWYIMAITHLHKERVAALSLQSVVVTSLLHCASSILK